VGSRTTYSAPADVPNAPDIIRQEATKATLGEAMTIAMFPDGTRVAVYDNGRVKIGRDHYKVKVDRTFNFGRGNSDHGSGFLWLEFEPLPE
jgi:hypothetical protein